MVACGVASKSRSHATDISKQTRFDFPACLGKIASSRMAATDRNQGLAQTHETQETQETQERQERHDTQQTQETQEMQETENAGHAAHSTHTAATTEHKAPARETAGAVQCARDGTRQDDRMREETYDGRFEEIGKCGEQGYTELAKPGGGSPTTNAFGAPPPVAGEPPVGDQGASLNEELAAQQQSVLDSFGLT